jgi:hypothetical protein
VFCFSFFLFASTISHAEKERSVDGGLGIELKLELYNRVRFIELEDSLQRLYGFVSSR